MADAVALIGQGADLHANVIDGETPLQFANEYGHSYIAAMLRAKSTVELAKDTGYGLVIAAHG